MRFQKLLRDADEFMPGRGNAQMAKNLRSNQFIDEDSPVLRVILEFHDVAMAVGGFQKVGLRPAPHLTDEADGVYRHGT